MIYEEIGQSLLHVALIFGVCVIISLVVFIIGLIIVSWIIPIMNKIDKLIIWINLNYLNKIIYLLIN